MMRSAWVAALGGVGLLTSAAVATAPTSEPPATVPAGSTASAAPFAIPTDRLAALDAAGIVLDIGAAYPAQPAGVAWPTQDWPTGDPVGADQDAINVALLTAFDNPAGGAGGIDAVLVVQDGKLVVEHYKTGYDPDTAHISWSMAKSITGTMIGMLVAAGLLDPMAPAEVPEWADTSDPRHQITVDDLLHMRSGLQWNEEYSGQSDVIEMLFGSGKDDRAHYAASKPLQDEPGSTWSYSTGTSMILSRIIADHVGFGDEGTAWAQDHLFGPLGITTVEHDLDASGVMSGGSNINMSGRDFARFGLLNLRGGNWDGTQIVPSQWVDYERTPFVDAPEYGAQWWVGQDASLPRTFYADGFNGQRIVVVPDLDLVVVVLSNDGTDLPDRTARAMVDAFRPTGSASTATTAGTAGA
jgi:CubicO group peptidase (beta-lactamase class C family)